MGRTSAVSWWGGILLMCGAVGLSGCSGKEPPTAALSQANLAVQEATTKSKAAQYAPLALHTAREQLQQAQEAMRKEEYDKARRLAENALVNAQLAQVQAQAEETRQSAEALQKTIQSLRQETQQAPTNR